MRAIGGPSPGQALPGGVRSIRPASSSSTDPEPRMRRALLLLLPLALLACASNEKRGDQAAAVGDWKSAERQYAQALQSDPSNPEKRAKWQQARTQALQGAVAAAQACRVSQDWECAFVESDYAARLEPGSSEYAALRAEAARNVA